MKRLLPAHLFPRKIATLVRILHPLTHSIAQEYHGANNHGCFFVITGLLPFPYILCSRLEDILSYRIRICKAVMLFAFNAPGRILPLESLNADEYQKPHGTRHYRSRQASSRNMLSEKV